MTDKTKYLIIGIGKFAQGFLYKLREEGVKESNIFLVDESEETINKLAQEKYSNLIIQKINDISFLEDKVPMNEIDILLIGSADFQFSTQIAYSLSKNKYNIKKIYAKADNEMHRRILENFGIDKEYIVVPEFEIGKKIALKSFFDKGTDITDFIGEYAIISLVVKNEELRGLSVQEISDVWSSKNNEERNWTIISIADNENNIFVATSKEKIFIEYKITLFCSKKDRRKLYNFFTKNKK